MNKIIDLDKTIYELVSEFPEVKEIMFELGFTDIVKPEAIEVMGRHMTLKMGSQIKGIPMDKIIEAFKADGFEIKDSNDIEEIVKEPQTKEELLKSYIQRLNDGEDLETVRSEFVKSFKHVSVHDIIKVEQDIIDSGTDVSDVQKLCDLHSALFHGMTEEEIYAEEENLKYEEGFPLNILKLENKGLKNELDILNNALNVDDIDTIKSSLLKLKDIKKLYQKKEELLMPLLYEYGITGPSDVMWGVDDEIKTTYSKLASSLSNDNYSSLKDEIIKVSNRTTEMIYKEENILFPMASEKFSLEDWVNVYFDIDENGHVYVSDYPTWEFAEKRRKKKELSLDDGYINLDCGKIKVSQLNALLKYIPIDITFIDEDDINRVFINNEHVFPRPNMALDRKVYLCHPPRIVDMIKSVLQSFKDGTKDEMVVWTPNKENPIKVTYLAVRDENNKYIGTVELVQNYKKDIEKLKEILK